MDCGIVGTDGAGCWGTGFEDDTMEERSFLCIVVEEMVSNLMPSQYKPHNQPRQVYSRNGLQQRDQIE